MDDIEKVKKIVAEETSTYMLGKNYHEQDKDVQEYLLSLGDSIAQQICELDPKPDRGRLLTRDSDNFYELIQSCKGKLIDDLHEADFYPSPITSSFLWMEGVIEHIAEVFVKAQRDLTASLIIERVKGMKNPYDCVHDPCYAYEVSSIEYGTDFEQEYCEGCQSDGYNQAIQAVIKELEATNEQTD